MATGRVKWFSDEKGFGFITPDEGERDLFVHFSAIKGQTGRRTLNDGDPVEYEHEASEKGPRVVEVRVLD